MAIYKIHPGIGIARLGNSDTEFYLAPENPAGLPHACDSNGNPSYRADGVTPVLVSTFKDDHGRIKRQAARFQVYVYDEASPDGRPLKIGDPIEGGGNNGTLIDIQWQVYVANKKSSWYEFNATQGEHGYRNDHPRRNASVVDSARSRLIIDPGPRIVNGTTKRRASFDRTGEGSYATTFPPPELAPFSIDTLGEMMTDDTGRLLVLGGQGRAGSEISGPGEPHISNYANNDGWYDDVSDWPVMARLIMFSQEVQRRRYIDVQYPAWVIVGYPRYAPEILDMVTMDEVLYDLYLRESAYDTSLYGRVGTFDDPDRVDFRNDAQLRQWQDSRLSWNTDFKPLFYRDIWPILYRPDQFRFLCDILGQSNYPHDQEQRGLFDPKKLAIVPGSPAAQAVERDQRALQTVAPLATAIATPERLSPKVVQSEAEEQPKPDPYGPIRQFLFGLLRLPGEENEFKLEDRVSSRLHNLPLMPLLCGDNPLTNTTPAKFFRLTDYQLFILKQWADGRFINEIEQGWLKSPPYTPFLPYPTAPPKIGRQLDRGVLSNALGGSFCPGGEASWIMRNPSIYWEPYRIKPDRSISDFLETAAQVNQTGDIGPDYTFNVSSPLSQDNDFDTGLQPGDITKYAAVPWQADFNECTTNPINVTYADWNQIYPDSDNDSRLRRDQKLCVTLWWPAHRPLQYSQLLSVVNGQPNFLWTTWTRGIPQTSRGDLKMVTAWSSLRFIIRNPFLGPDAYTDGTTGDPPIYVSMEHN